MLSLKKLSIEEDNSVIMNVQSISDVVQNFPQNVDSVSLTINRMWVPYENFISKILENELKSLTLRVRYGNE